MMTLLIDLFSYWDGTQSLGLEPLTVLGTLGTEQETFPPKELLLKHTARVNCPTVPRHDIGMFHLPPAF